MRDADAEIDNLLASLYVLKSDLCDSHDFESAALVRDACNCIKKLRPKSALDLVAEKAREMTPDEFRESLIRAGIINKNGELKKAYRKGE